MLLHTTHETAWREEDGYVLLLLAIVEQCKRDLVMPTRSSSHRAELPTVEEQEEAWLFLKAMMNSGDRASGQYEEAPGYGASVGLDACKSWQRKRRMAWQRKELAMMQNK